jgi:hypothetical protein
MRQADRPGKGQKGADMPARGLWFVDMGDGTAAVCCMGCRQQLFRGPKRRAGRVYKGHRCRRPRKGGGRR